MVNKLLIPFVFLYMLLCFTISVLLLIVVKTLEYSIKLISYIGVSATKESMTTGNWINRQLGKHDIYY